MTRATLDAAEDERLTAAGADVTPAPIWADVLIVGGGLVGGTLAIALADAGLTSLVVEAGDPQAALDAGFDGRCSAVALSSKRMLVALGLWQALAADAAPMLDIRVADGTSRLFLHYDHHEVGDEPFGFMVENRLLRRALLTRMRGGPAVRSDRARPHRQRSSGPATASMPASPPAAGCGPPCRRRRRAGLSRPR